LKGLGYLSRALTQLSQLGRLTKTRTFAESGKLFSKTAKAIFDLVNMRLEHDLRLLVKISECDPADWDSVLLPN